MLLDDDVLNAFDGICHILDREGNILAVGPDNWSRFAESAGDTALNAQAVKRQNIFDFIAGEPVRKQIRQVMDTLISGKVADWVMPYRCDSPDTRRNMRISIRPIRDEESVTGFLFQSIVLDESQRPPLDIFDFAELEKKIRAAKETPFGLDV
jgi:hypothetical protein